MAKEQTMIVKVEGLKKYYPIKEGIFKKVKSYVKAANNVNFYINKGESLGLIGESGSGKTTVGRCLLRIIEPTEGKIKFLKENTSDQYLSITELTKKQLKWFRREAQMIFQNPYSCLNSRMTILEIIGEPLLIHKISKGKELENRIKEIIEAVRIKKEDLRRYPHSFSVGQRQRISRARSLILKPKFLVCDEVVSALDVSIQAQILNLLKELQQKMGLTYLFISHDISTVKYTCNRIVVMYCGNFMELTDTKNFLENPLHPYSEALISAIPKMDPRNKIKSVLKGEVPNLVNPPKGCVFHTRCRYCKDICKNEVPKLRDIGDGRLVSCHFAESLDLQGFKS